MLTNSQTFEMTVKTKTCISAGHQAQTHSQPPRDLPRSSSGGVSGRAPGWSCNILREDVAKGVGLSPCPGGSNADRKQYKQSAEAKDPDAKPSLATAERWEILWRNWEVANMEAKKSCVDMT